MRQVSWGVNDVENYRLCDGYALIREVIALLCGETTTILTSSRLVKPILLTMTSSY